MNIFKHNKDSQLVEELQALQAENAVLKNAEFRFRMLVEQSRDGIVILSRDCKVFYANQKFADMLGYTLEETSNLYVWDWDKSLAPDTVLELAAAVDEKGHHFETVHTRKDTSTFDVELSNSGTIIDGKKLIFCICRDISERKRYDAQLQQSEELLSTFIDNFKGIAYQVSADQCTSFAPRLFRGSIEAITGYAPSDFTTQKTWNSIVHPDDISRLQHTRTQCFEFPETEADIEYRIIAQNGQVLWVKESARIVKIGNEKLLHGTIFNISQQKKAEEEKCKLEEQVRHSQKLEAIGTLAGGIAHDFNNILSILMGYTELTLRSIQSENQAHSHLTQIQKAINRARDIIQQLLTFSRRVDILKKQVDVGPIISEVLTFLRSTLPANVDIRLNLDNNKELILADPSQIHQVIMNLCVNAAQALQNHEGIITITVTSQSISLNEFEVCNGLPEGKYVRIDVNDNGPGIPSEIAGRIFDPYFTTRGEQKGSGMGLAVVHGIIKNHDGFIRMSSTRECGTTFTVFLPAVYTKAEPAEIITAPDSTRAESILFVDDEVEITAIGQLMLEDRGFQVKTEVNPYDALNTFRENPDAYDCIITDMTMPHMTGDTLFKEVRKIRSDIPVILCTGYSEFITEEIARGMGISAFMPKPLSCDDLVKEIKTVINKNKTLTTAGSRQLSTS